jgi:hypothetical protein
MEQFIQDRIAQLAELGTQSPLHAVRATEEIRRLTDAVTRAPSPATAIDPNIYPAAPIQAPIMEDPGAWRNQVTEIQSGFDPLRYQATGTRLQTRERIPIPMQYPMGVAPSQVPPVIDARNHPPSFAQMIQPQMAPNLWLTVPGIPSLAPGQESPGERLEFDIGDGLLILMRGTALAQYDDPYEVRADKAIDALIGVKITINGQEQLIVDGQAESWAWFSDLFTPDIPGAPLARHVLTSDTLTVRFLNRANGDGPTIQPSLQFSYRRLPMPV